MRSTAPRWPSWNSRKSVSSASGNPEEETIEDRNGVLLGIKYEAAKIGGVDEAALTNIEEQLTEVIGEDWASDEQVLRGRNAVRREHGLPGLGEPGDRPSPNAAASRTLWRRVLGR